MPRHCEQHGCDKPHRARGLCGTHYNQSHQPNRHKKHEYKCDECGNTMLKEAGRGKRYEHMYCTPKCRDRARADNARLKHSVIDHYKPAPAWHKLFKLPTQVLTSSGVRFMAGYCEVCKRPFVDPYGAKACSDECQAMLRTARRCESKQRRRARERAAYVAPVARLRIYERDNYTCKLCNYPLDMEARAPHPHAPTIDHVLALANGGTHEPNNVQAAHFRCNSLKGAQVNFTTPEVTAGGLTTAF